MIRAAVAADDREERYETYYAGDKAEYESRYNYFATKGGALAAAKGDAYVVRPPRKVKRRQRTSSACSATTATT